MTQLAMLSKMALLFLYSFMTELCVGLLLDVCDLGLDPRQRVDATLLGQVVVVLAYFFLP